MTDTKPNAALAYRVLDHIDAHPETWDQSTWDCGTAACFAGWAVRLSGGTAAIIGNSTEVVTGPDDIVGLSVQEAAETLLRIDTSDTYLGDDDTDWLFSEHHNRESLGRLVEKMFGPRPQAVRSGAEDYR